MGKYDYLNDEAVLMKPILIIRILQKIFQEGTGFRD
jgi:hypothetical protein